MIIRVIEKNGKWEHETYCIDTDKLDPNNPVEAAVLKELKKDAKRKKRRSEIHVCFDAYDNDLYDGDPATMSSKVVVKTDEQVLWLSVDYDG